MKKALGIVVVVLGVWALVVYMGGDRGGRGPGGPEGTRGAGAGKEGEEGRLAVRLSSWPQAAREAAEQMIQKYGQPAEIGEERLTWHESGDWKRTIVHRDGGDNPLEQIAVHPIPSDKAGQLAQLQGVSVEAGTNELAVRGSREENNFLAANIAHEFLAGEKTIAEAQQAFTREKAFSKAGRSSVYLRGLRFDETGKTRGDEERR